MLVNIFTSLFEHVTALLIRDKKILKEVFCS